MSSKKLVLGLAGNMGNGKNFVAEVASGFADAWGVGAIEIAMADEVKRLARNLFPSIEVEQLWGPSARRNEPVPGGYTRPDGSVLTVRHVLQQLGTDLGRNLYQNVWVDKLFWAVEQLDAGFSLYDRVAGVLPYSEVDRPNPWGLARLVVVPDVRFPNEVEAIRKSGGQVWWVHGNLPEPTATTTEARNHASETSLDAVGCDKVIRHNFEGQEAMMDRLEPILTDFLKVKVVK